MNKTNCELGQTKIHHQHYNPTHIVLPMCSTPVVLPMCFTPIVLPKCSASVLPGCSIQPASLSIMILL